MCAHMARWCSRMASGSSDGTSVAGEKKSGQRRTRGSLDGSTVPARISVSSLAQKVVIATFSVVSRRTPTDCPPDRDGRWHADQAAVLAATHDIPVDLVRIPTTAL